MSDTGVVIGIVSFMLIFNGLALAYGASSVSSDAGITLPEFPADPSVWDYILIPFQYIGLFFQLAYYTITGLPAFIAIFVVIIDLALGYELIKLARGV